MPVEDHPGHIIHKKLGLFKDNDLQLRAHKKESPPHQVGKGMATHLSEGE